MRRSLITATAALGLGMAPASAHAAVVELGATTSPLVAPSCPSGIAPANCTIILTRVTALETLRDGVAYPSTVKVAGRIVSFTVGLSRLSNSRTTAHQDIHLLDATYGGTTRVAITVLRPTGPARQRSFTVVGQSPAYHVQPYLGQVVEFPLEQSIDVRPGDVVGLTTPTWAPVLSIQQASSRFAYRQSRSTSCSSPPSITAAQGMKQTAVYGCNYPGTRVEYTAKEVPYPLTATPVHAADGPSSTRR